MATYLDKNNRERDIVIDVAAVERCRSRLGVNLYNLDQLGDLTGDMMRFLRVIHCVSGYQSSNFEDWWKEHTGDAGDRCVEAFVETLCDFFPSRLAAMVRDMNKRVSQAVEEAWSTLEKELAGTSGSLQGISASTLAD